MEMEQRRKPAVCKEQRNSSNFSIIEYINRKIAILKNDAKPEKSIKCETRKMLPDDKGTDWLMRTKYKYTCSRLRREYKFIYVR